MRSASIILSITLLLGGVRAAFACPAAQSRESKACCCKASGHAPDREGAQRLERPCCCVLTHQADAAAPTAAAVDPRPRDDASLFVAALGVRPQVGARLPIVDVASRHRASHPPADTLVSLHALLLC